MADPFNQVMMTVDAYGHYSDDEDYEDDDSDYDDLEDARITRAMIDTALAKCDGSLDEDELDDDMMAAEEPVVVARGVTAQDLLLVPDEWLGYNRLALLPDGTLIVDRLDTEEHRLAVSSAAGACYDYVTSNRALGLAVRPGIAVRFGELGVRHPDVVVVERLAQPNRRRVPRVIVEIVFECPTSDRYIDMATEYLRYNEDVVRVIVFKFCTCRRRVNSPSDDLWDVPALAIVFGRMVAADGVFRVGILETQSFGNVGVLSGMVDSLCGAVHHEGLVPLDHRSGEALLAPGIQRDDIAISLMDDLQAMWDRGDKLMFSVAIPAMAIIHFNLLDIFLEAMVGREGDEQDRHAGRVPHEVRQTARHNP